MEGAIRELMLAGFLGASIKGMGKEPKGKN